MSISPLRGQEQWEYRHLFVIPQQAENTGSNWKHDAPGSVENLVETVGDLDRARAQGWKLLSVKIEEDDNGRCWMNAYMKRRKRHGLCYPPPEG